MFIQDLSDRPSFDRPWMNDYNFHLVDTIPKLKKLVDLCLNAGIYSLDTETTGLDTRVYPDSYFEDGKKTRNGLRTIATIVGVCISFDGKNGYYVPLAHEPEGSNNLPWDPAWDEITRLTNSSAKAIFHNAKYDHEILYPVIGKEQWKIGEYEDTFLIAKVLNPLKGFPSGLKPLSKAHYNVDMIELEDLFTPEMVAQLKRDHKGTHNFGVLHPKEGLAYGCSDGIFTFKLYHTLIEKLSPGDKKIYNLEKSFCNVLRKMERNRVHIDVERVKQLNSECDHELQHVGDLIRNAIEERTGKSQKWLTLNVGSPKQLSNAFFTDPEGLRIKPTAFILGEGEDASPGGSDGDDDDSPSASTPIGAIKQYSLKDEALKSLDEAYGRKFMIELPDQKDKEGNPKKVSLFNLVIEWRHYLKMKGSYIEPLSLAVDKNGDVRPDFRQMGTDTARLASRAGNIEDGYSGINPQGIPRDSDDDKPELFKQIRSCIIPREGYMLVKLDFAGEELRVVTNLSGDPIWTDSFLNKDGDVHAITAKTLFGKEVVSKDERNRGKRCNFAFIYGGGSGAIQRNIGCSSEDAQRHMANLKQDVPVLMGYVDSQKEYAKKHKGIYTAYGRKIPIPTIDSPIREIRSKAERCAINYTIQATSADILKFAMCFVDKNIRERKWDDDVKYVLTVHDEVVYEVRPHMLMEVVRLLDEWMTMPWKLPKAHGRDWVVPLLTEPGIDINWKARYNYFNMVDGVPADPKKIIDGQYTGKLKKGEFFEGGRIYEKIPDFLKSYVFKNGQKPDDVVADQAEVVSNPPVESEPEIQIPAEAAPEETVGDDISLDAVGDLSDYSDVSDTPPPAEVPSIDVKIEDVSPKEKPYYERTEYLKPVRDGVYRFTLRCALNDYNMRRLHAICILAEGEDLIRIYNNEGKVLIDESRSPKVKLEEFITLSKLFGLG